MTLFQKFKALSIDCSAIGLLPEHDFVPYYCTPKGAKLIGRTGVDGIHFCFVRGFGEMVFAVSPMNGADDCVHPVAADFADFLSLLLACGSVDAIEQAWMWDKAQFDAYLADNPPNERQQEILQTIAEQLDIVPIHDPYWYIKEIQQDFDCSKIPFSAEYYETVGIPEPEKPIPEWKVYFNGSFWENRGRERAGTKLALNRQFDWAGEEWHLPAAYLCGKGMVLDFCISVPKQRFLEFQQKWMDAESLTEEQRDTEHPLNIDFDATLTVNGKQMRQSHGSSICYLPDDCLPEGIDTEQTAEDVRAHYELDESKIWVFWRISFPWATKRKPAVSSIQLHLKRDPVAISGIHFTTPAQQTVHFTHPVTGAEYTLTVREQEQQQMPENAFPEQNTAYPRHYTALTYTISPALSSREFSLTDCAPSDPPRVLAKSDPFAPESAAAAAIAIIGGADGPTAIILCPRSSRQNDLHAACSSLHFAPVDAVEWRMVFHCQTTPDCEVTLLELD